MLCSGKKDDIYEASNDKRWHLCTLILITFTRHTLKHRYVCAHCCGAFNLYTNNIIVGIDSEIRLFADDCVCYRQIDSVEDIETPKGYRSIGQMGQEMGYEISACEI